MQIGQSYVMSIQLSAEGFPNTWLPETLKSVQIHPNIIDLCPALVACCNSNLGQQYMKKCFLVSNLKVFHPEAGWRSELGTPKLTVVPFLKLLVIKQSLEN